jgi:superfamily II DNA/RNA helicase
MGRGGRNRKRRTSTEVVKNECGNRSESSVKSPIKHELDDNFESRKRSRDGTNHSSSCSEPLVHVSKWTDDRGEATKNISSHSDKQSSSLPSPFIVDNSTNQIHITRSHQTITNEFEESHTNHIQEIWKSLLLRRNTSKASSWSKPTHVQLHSWPILLSKQHYSLIQISPTGSGKTLAYCIPAIIRCCNLDSHTDTLVGKSILVLVPTRELVIQVQKQFEMIIRAMTIKADIKVIPCHGGVSKIDQVDTILNAIGCHLIVVGTSGRVLDMVDNNDDLQSKLFKNLSMIVLDEADRLAVNIDLQSQIDKILNLGQINTNFVNNRQQIVLCSATFPRNKAEIVWNRWINQRPCVVIKIDAISLDTNHIRNERIKKSDFQSCQSLDGEAETLLFEAGTCTALEGTESGENKVNSTKEKVFDSLLVSKIPSTVSQILHVCSDHKKPRKLIRTIQTIFNETNDKRNIPLGIVFCSTIKTVQFVHKLLKKENIVWNCAELHSQLKQNIREKTISDFKCGKAPLLIATDIAARGLHVNNIQYVINYDFPTNLEQYIHRCGRAGRKLSMTTATAGTQQAANNASREQKHTRKEDARVYSFFSRFLAPLAPDLIHLLESTNQWIDPNLIDLCYGTMHCKSSRPKKDDPITT